MRLWQARCPRCQSGRRQSRGSTCLAVEYLSNPGAGRAQLVACPAHASPCPEVVAIMIKFRGRRLELTDFMMFFIGSAIVILVVGGSASTLAAGKYTARQWTDLIVYGIALGSIYSLIALGYTLVYGILRMINFAHSEVFMAGPFTAYFLADALGKSGFLDRYLVVSLISILLLSMAVSMTVAVLLERIAYRPP